MMRFEMVSPRPLPPKRAIAGPSWWNSSKMCGRSLAGMPTPVSETEMTTSRSSALAETVTPPTSVKRVALLKRLIST